MKAKDAVRITVLEWTFSTQQPKLTLTIPITAQEISFSHNPEWKKVGDNAGFHMTFSLQHEAWLQHEVYDELKMRLQSILTPAVVQAPLCMQASTHATVIRVPIILETVNLLSTEALQLYESVINELLVEKNSYFSPPNLFEYFLVPDNAQWITLSLKLFFEYRHNKKLTY